MRTWLEDALNWVKKWVVPAASVLVVLAALLAGISYMIRSEVQGITDEVLRLNTDVGALQGGLAKANDRIDSLLTNALNRAFPQPSAIKQNSAQGMKAAGEIIELAKTQNIHLDPKIVSGYGMAVASLNDLSLVPSTLTPLAEYRSTLNSASLPNLPQPGANIGNTHYIIFPKSPTNKTFRLPSEMQSFGDVSRDQEAVLEPIGTHGTQNATTGPALILIEGGNLTLDTVHAKNVIFRNSRIQYGGGPLYLENVYFDNCKFEITATKAGQEFALAAVQSSPVKLLM